MRLPRLTFANAIALVALFVSLGGTVYAAAKINGKTIRKESIPANRLKADSLTGAQINEASLATVPRAQRAQEVTKALMADRVAEAAHADLAARAERATVAGRAGRASEADHAKDTDLAQHAPDASTLNRLSSSDYLRDCAETGSIKGYVVVDPSLPGDHVRERFNCTGQDVEVVTRGPGNYAVTFRGLDEAAGLGLATAYGFHSATSASLEPGPAPRTWQVLVFSTLNEDLLGGEPFSLTVF